MSSENPTPDHRRARARLRRRRVSQRVVVGAPQEDLASDPGVDERSAVQTEDVDPTPAATDPAPPAGPPEHETPPRPDRGRGRLSAAVGAVRTSLPGSAAGRAVAALLVVALATTMVLGWRVLETRAVDSARSSALSAARDSVTKVLSYDHRHIAKDFAAAREGLTPSFGKQYAKSEDVVGPTARKYDVKVKASVAEAAVVRASSDRVVLLVYVNQRTASDRLDGPRVDLARVRVTMVEQDGAWKIDDLDAL